MKEQGTRNIGRRIGIILLALTLSICISPVSVHAAGYDGEEAARAARYNAELRRDGWLDMRSYGGYDCTNFVSHCLRAGGLVQHLPGGGAPKKKAYTTTDYWYLAKKGTADAWSTSWSVVSDLREYMNGFGFSDSNGKASVTAYLFQKNASGDKHFRQVISTLKLGDIVQYDDNGNRHSVIITREGTNERAVKNSSHKTDRMNSPIENVWSVAKDRCTVPGMPGFYRIYVISMRQ